jgi:hypothetical protein
MHPHPSHHHHHHQHHGHHHWIGFAPLGMLALGLFFVMFLFKSGLIFLLLIGAGLAFILRRKRGWMMANWGEMSQADREEWKRWGMEMRDEWRSRGMEMRDEWRGRGEKMKNDWRTMDEPSEKSKRKNDDGESVYL